MRSPHRRTLTKKISDAEPNTNQTIAEERSVSIAYHHDQQVVKERQNRQMVKEVASKTSDVAGDGTTTAAVLAQKAPGPPPHVSELLCTSP